MLRAMQALGFVSYAALCLVPAAAAAWFSGDLMVALIVWGLYFIWPIGLVCWVAGRL